MNIIKNCRTCRNVKQDKELRLYCSIKSDTRKDKYVFCFLNGTCENHSIDNYYIVEKK